MQQAAGGGSDPTNGVAARDKSIEKVSN